MPSRPEFQVKAFRGPNLLLPCPSSMVEIGETDWPLLRDAARRGTLSTELHATLRVVGDEMAWQELATAESLPPIDFLARLLALTALALQRRVGRSVTRHTTYTPSDSPGRRVAVWEHFFINEGLSAGRRAGELLQGWLAAKHGKAKRAGLVEAAVARLREDLPDPVADVIMEGMTARGLPWRIFDHQWPTFEVGTGCRRQRLMTSMPDSQGHLDRMIFRNKFLAAAILREAGLPMPRHELAGSAEQAAEAAERIGYPVVVKPVDAGRSKGVTVNLRDPEAIPEAYAFARQHGSSVLVERFIPGLPYRILILDGEVLAVALRGVPSVTGDGTHSVGELVERENARREEENLNRSQPLPSINLAAFEEECHRRLGEQGLNLDAVPEDGREVWLAHHAQRGRGGLNVDVTAEVHPDHFDLAKQIAEIMRCPMIGIDFITEDIRRSFREVACGINEVNIEPALNLHMRMTRTPRDVVTPLLDSVFPVGDGGRVPLLAVHGTAAAPLDLLRGALRAAGFCVGFAERDGQASIGGVALRLVSRPDRRVESLLFDPRVEALVLELNDEDFSRGLVFDRCGAALLLPPAGLSLGSVYAAGARLLQGMTDGPLVLPLEMLEPWQAHHGRLQRPVVLFSEAPGLEMAALEGLMAAGHRVVGRLAGAPQRLGVFLDGHFDLLAETGGQSAEETRALLLAAAGLLALDFPPARARRSLNDALEAGWGERRG